MTNTIDLRLIKLCISMVSSLLIKFNEKVIFIAQLQYFQLLIWFIACFLRFIRSSTKQQLGNNCFYVNHRTEKFLSSQSSNCFSQNNTVKIYVHIIRRSNGPNKFIKTPCDHKLPWMEDYLINENCERIVDVT